MVTTPPYIKLYIVVEDKNECNDLKIHPEEECRSRSMRKTHALTEDRNEPGSYEIRIKGHLDKHWAAWFEGLTITLEEDGDTLLTGPIVDQAALHGLLKKVRDLGLPLLSVCPVKPYQADTSDVKPPSPIQ
jgi:hypothetical protein